MGGAGYERWGGRGVEIGESNISCAIKTRDKNEGSSSRSDTITY